VVPLERNPFFKARPLLYALDAICLHRPVRARVSRRDPRAHRLSRGRARGAPSPAHEAARWGSRRVGSRGTETRPEIIETETALADLRQSWS